MNGVVLERIARPRRYRGCDWHLSDLERLMIGADAAGPVRAGINNPQNRRLEYKCPDDTGDCQTCHSAATGNGAPGAVVGG